MTRHQRRKASVARNSAKTERLAKAALAYRTAEIVKANLSNPVRGKRSGKGLGNRAIYTGVW